MIGDGLRHVSQEQNGHIAEVAKCVREVHQIPDVGSLTECGNETLEDGRVECDVGDVEAEARESHEGEGLQVPLALEDRGDCEDPETGDGENQGGEEGSPVRSDVDADAREQEYPEHDHGLRTCVDAGFALDTEVAPDLDREVVPEAAAYRQEKEHDDQAQDSDPVTPKERNPVLLQHRLTTCSLGDIPVVWRGDLAEEIDAEEEKGDEQEPRCDGHPHLRNSVLQDEGLADGLEYARRQDEAGAEAGSEDLGHPASLEEGEDHSEDHPEGKAVHEEPDGVHGRRCDCEEEQGKLGYRNQAHDCKAPPVGGHLGHDSDADELRHRVSGDLGAQVESLERDGAEGQPVEGRCCEGLSVGVDAEVRPECCKYAIERKGSWSRFRQPAAKEAGPGDHSSTVREFPARASQPAVSLFNLQPSTNEDSRYPVVQLDPTFSSMLTILTLTLLSGLPTCDDMGWTGVLDEASFAALHELREGEPPALMGRDISLDGELAYLSVPERGTPIGAVIVIHEWWGLNQHVRHWADRLASDGYTALAVDLYGGKVAETREDAMAAMRAVDEQQALGTLRSAHRYLVTEQGAERTGCIGWCFGGGWSLKLAMAEPELDAAVIYYGRLVTDPGKLKSIRANVMGVFGDRDGGIPPEAVQDFADGMREAGMKLSLRTYDAEHAFANPSSARYDAAHAADAWEATRSFLCANLWPEPAKGSIARGSRTLEVEAPEGWIAGRPRPMRNVTFDLGQSTECYAMALGGTGGGLRPNLDRWRRQMGLAPLSDEELASLPRIPMFGKMAVMIRAEGSYTSMAGDSFPEAVMLGAVCALEDETVFVKLIGPRAEVLEQEEAFVPFCRSLR